MNNLSWISRGENKSKIKEEVTQVKALSKKMETIKKMISKLLEACFTLMAQSMEQVDELK